VELQGQHAPPAPGINIAWNRPHGS
jgi:hypothetical protein